MAGTADGAVGFTIPWIGACSAPLVLMSNTASTQPQGVQLEACPQMLLLYLLFADARVQTSSCALPAVTPASATFPLVVVGYLHACTIRQGWCYDHV